MSKIKIIKVKSCLTCPYCKTRGFKKICGLIKKRPPNFIIDVSWLKEIPDFCPLENEQ